MPAKRLTIQPTFTREDTCYEQQVERIARASLILRRGQERRLVAEASKKEELVWREKEETSFRL